jgi:sec-independent protein translocase protein TatB
MFDFAGSEIVLIGIVALVLIGPKDLPIAIKGISTAIKKMRRMAGEFQTHVDEMVREANLSEVKETLGELRGLNVKSAVRRAIDPDNTLHGALADPFRERPVRPVMGPLDQPVTETAVAERAAPASLSAAPAFVPPNAAPPSPIQPATLPPAFVPPAGPDHAGPVEG